MLQKEIWTIDDAISSEHLSEVLYVYLLLTCEEAWDEQQIYL